MVQGLDFTLGIACVRGGKTCRRSSQLAGVRILFFQAFLTIDCHCETSDASLN